MNIRKKFWKIFEKNNEIQNDNTKIFVKEFKINEKDLLEQIKLIYFEYVGELSNEWKCRIQFTSSEYFNFNNKDKINIILNNLSKNNSSLDCYEGYIKEVEIVQSKQTNNENNTKVFKHNILFTHKISFLKNYKCYKIYQQNTLETLKFIFNKHQIKFVDEGVICLKQHFFYQYNETDFDFIKRVMYLNGIFYRLNKHNEIYLFSSLSEKLNSNLINNNIAYYDTVSVLKNNKNPLFESISYDYKKPNEKINYSNENNEQQIFVPGYQSEDIKKINYNVSKTFFIEKSIEVLSSNNVHKEGFIENIESEIINKLYNQNSINGFCYFTYFKIHQGTIKSFAYFIPDDNPLYKFGINQKLIKFPKVENQIGIIYGENNDVLIDSNNPTLVKVQFLWDYKKENICFAQVSQFWTGENYGIYFPLRSGQEVLIGFQNGLSELPIVLGCVYNGNNLNTNIYNYNTTSIIRTSNPTKSGQNDKNILSNEIVFHDKENEELLALNTKKNLHINSTNDVNLLIKNGNNFTQINKGNKNTGIEEGNYSINIKKGGLNIKSNNNIQISSNEQIEITSSKKICLKVGNNEITISEDGISISGAEINLKSNIKTSISSGQLNISGSESTNIKGGLINLN